MPPRFKLPESEADHSPHLVPRVRISGTIPPLLHIPSLLGQEQLYVLFYLHSGQLGQSCYNGEVKNVDGKLQNPLLPNV
jgi:hypothetical protein